MATIDQKHLAADLWISVVAESFDEKEAAETLRLLRSGLTVAVTVLFNALGAVRVTLVGRPWERGQDCSDLPLFVEFAHESSRRNLARLWLAAGGAAVLGFPSGPWSFLYFFLPKFGEGTSA